MGTRHLITVVKNGEFKLAQYGQWDGYPSGQGAKILEFLTNGDVDAFRANVAKLYYVDDNEIDTLYEEAAGIAKGSQWINMEQSEKLKEKLPTLHRDTGAKVLEVIATGSSIDGNGRIPTSDMIVFSGNNICEWVYTIDLDNDVFEIFKAGFSEEQGENRFSDVIKKEFEEDEDSAYFVKLVGSYKLDALPTFDEFLGDLDPAALESHRARVAALAAEEQAVAEEADEGDRPNPM